MQKLRNLDDRGMRAAVGRPKTSQTTARGPDTNRGQAGRFDVRVFAWLHCNADGGIADANATLAAWLGFTRTSAMIARPLVAILQDESCWERWRSTTEAVVEEVCLRSAEGRPVPVRAELRPPKSGQDGIELFMVREPENELIARIARLEAALTLTAGTVHDVNNVLTVLAGNLFLLTENVRGKAKLYEQARRARNAAERGSTLLRELLTFGRETDDTSKAISPASLAFALQPLLARAIGAEHELKFAVDGKSGSVLASAAQLESVLINLVINARDALSQHGEVEIRVADARLDEGRDAPPGLLPGDYVCLSVRDTGNGIPENILDRVTEPMFSTKPPDHGSGLGLAMVRRFAEQAHGLLQIESAEGEGTCVTVWLPRSGQLAETTVNMTLPLSTLPGGEERLLLVSRDREARGAVQQILETLGYDVVVADSPEDVDGVISGSQPPALVISERSGVAPPMARRWLESLRESNPTLKHIALLQAGTDAQSEASDADGHVYRPVTVAELARTVRDVLEES